MSDTAHAEVPAPPKPRRKGKRRARKTGNVVPFRATDEFAGMTETECCDGCRPDKCVISAVGVCAHPLKAGLQTELAKNPERFARYERARKLLKHRKLDLARGDV